MARKTEEKALSYYQQELHYLRQNGAYFAQKYPKIAKRLDMHQGESSDPHVERLLESFAYLTSKLQREIDDKFPRVTSTMLSILYPHLVNPVPSMSVAQFEVDPSKGKLTEGYLLPRHTPVLTQGMPDVTCRFQTCYDVTLWPIALEAVTFCNADDYTFNKSVLSSNQLMRFRFRSLGLPFSALSTLFSLTFYVTGASALTKNVYELFASCDPAVFASSDEGTTLSFLGKNGLQFKGFADTEALLPFAAQEHSAYRLLQEYFVFPEKFLFFDLKMGALGVASDTLDLFISLAKPLSLAEQETITPQNFLLGCTPIVNLFNKISEPLRLDHLSTEYRLIPDLRRERTTEIYSIRRVSSAPDTSPLTKVYQPYFNQSFSRSGENVGSYWFSQRRPTVHPNITGTDIYLSFVDLDFNPTRPSEETVFAHITCMNRGLVEQMEPGSPLQIEEAAPATKIICLQRPTPQLEAPTEASSQWQLISCLNLNALSLEKDDNGQSPLIDLLSVFGAGGRNNALREAQSIHNVSYNKVIRRLHPEGWRGFAQGINVALTLNERDFMHVSPLLFASVLAHFFSLYISVNSFAELELYSTSREGVWRRWPLMTEKQTQL